MTSEEFKGIPSRKPKENGLIDYLNAIDKAVKSNKYDYIFTAQNPNTVHGIIALGYDVHYLKPLPTEQSEEIFKQRAKERGNNIINIIENQSDIDIQTWTYFQEELIQNITTILSQERLGDLKFFLRLGLKWFKHAPINMYYHHYENKPQEYWRKWLIERTYMNDDKDLWSTWSQVQYMFWW